MSKTWKATKRAGGKTKHFSEACHVLNYDTIWQVNHIQIAEGLHRKHPQHSTNTLPSPEIFMLKKWTNMLENGQF
jgi:hypothetical protein